MQIQQQDKQLRIAITKARLSRGMSQRQLADKVGVSKQAIQKIEVGVLTPSLELAIKICKTLKIKIKINEIELDEDATNENSK